MSNLTGDDSQCTPYGQGREGELLCLKIKAHLEGLFSDRHLAVDGFLLNKIKRNKQGYVSLKFFTFDKGIKALTRNWHMTLAAAKYSDLLEVNDECTQVRRIKPLPKWLLCLPTSKVLLIWNPSEIETREDGAARGPEQLSLSERILQKFSADGSLTSFWILYPGKELPRDLRYYTKHHKELGQHLCAAVRFESLGAVHKAYNALKAEEEKSWRKGMCVMPLGIQSMHHTSKDESEDRNKDKPGDTPSQENPFETSGDSVQGLLSSPITVSDETPDTSQPPNALNSSIQRTFEQISTSCNSQQSFSGLSQRYSRLRWCSRGYKNKSSQIPWVLRRKFAARPLNHKTAGRPNSPHLVQRVLCQPLGPDGTRGVHNRRKLLQQEEVKLTPGESSTTCGRFVEQQHVRET